MEQAINLNNQDYQKAFLDGYTKGKKSQALNIAISLYKEGIDFNSVVRITGLSHTDLEFVLR